MSSIELRDARLARHPTAVEGHTVSRDDGDLAGLAFRRRCQLIERSAVAADSSTCWIISRIGSRRLL